jgi:pyruvate dehydrogenase E1 component beta subunit
MKDLDVNYGKHRVIDTPVSESAVTGMAVGASLCNSKPIVVHPRIDFMLYALDSIVNQAAKWSHMTGGQAHPCLTIRGIINRGGEQGAQHSQSLHSWFSHIPGLRVLMPASVVDARDMLITAVLCKDPVVYLDDRWLYDLEDELDPIQEKFIDDFPPKVIQEGKDLTIVGSSFSTELALETSKELLVEGINAEAIDLRTLNPFNPSAIIDSVLKTRRLVVVDGSWKNSGFSAEVISSVTEAITPDTLLMKPLRITLANSSAPTSIKLEEIYYPSVSQIVSSIKESI